MLENLSQIKDSKGKSITESIPMNREWNVVDYNSDIFVDKFRKDNVNQSTETDIEMKSSGKDKNNQRKMNSYDQPPIREL